MLSGNERNHISLFKDKISGWDRHFAIAFYAANDDTVEKSGTTQVCNRFLIHCIIFSKLKLYDLGLTMSKRVNFQGSRQVE